MPGTRRKPGKLGPYVEDFRSRLLALGYTTESTRSHLKAIGHLGRWLTAEGLEVSQLSEARVEAFLAACRYRRACASSAKAHISSHASRVRNLGLPTSRRHRKYSRGVQEE